MRSSILKDEVNSVHVSQPSTSKVDRTPAKSIKVRFGGKRSERERKEGFRFIDYYRRKGWSFAQIVPEYEKKFNYRRGYQTLAKWWDEEKDIQAGTSRPGYVVLKISPLRMSEILQWTSPT